MPSLAPMLEKVKPAVVNVLATGKTSNPKEILNDPSDMDGGDPRAKRKNFESIGSGVIVNANEGLILTNSHLIHQATSITVTLSDGRHFKATLIGSDPASDIAVLKIDANKLTEIQLADSSKAKVGDFVVAIGNPYGLTQTVTSGIVSGLERTDLGIEGYEDFIQTDASINPGNSGGALVNLKGELVGINTAILAPSGGNVGIGFAIPTNMAKSLMDQLIEYGKLGRGVVGVFIQNLTPELAHALGEKDAQGALVTNVTPFSPAAEAGIQVGDIIQTINKRPITSAGQVKNTIGLLRVGSKVNIDVLRKNKTMHFHLSSVDPETYKQRLNSQQPFFHGVAMRNFEAEVPGFNRLTGVQTLQIAENSPVWQAGVRPGDVIISVDNEVIHNIDDLYDAAKNVKDSLLVNVFRGNGTMFMIVQK